MTLDRPLPGRVAEGTADGAAGPLTVRALAYTDLVGQPAAGDALLLNVSALARGLGTGGYALVVGPAAAGTELPADPPVGPGHLVKARYTPLQSMVLGVDEQESPHHAVLADADSLDGVVGRLLLVDAQDHGLQGRVPGLDQVPRPDGRVGRQHGARGGGAHHEGVPAGAEAARQRRHVQQQRVTCRGLPHEVGVGQGADRQRARGAVRRTLGHPAGQGPVEGHLELEGSSPRPACGNHGPDPPRHHTVEVTARYRWS